MIARRRFLVLALIMVAACAMVMAIMTVTLYRHEIRKEQENLQVTAQSQARLIEAMARHDSAYAKNTPGGPTEATLSQIIDAHEHYEGFGETGEFTLARRDGDSIVFVLRHRYAGVEVPEPLAFDSDLAEPMRRALEGLSGTVIGLDYRGETVVAAYEPVDVLNLGIVAKIDLAEVRAPFIRTGLSAAAVGFLVVLAGTALFFRIGNPMIARLEAHSRELEKEVEERKRTERALLSSEARYRRHFELGAIGMGISSAQKCWLQVNDRLCEILGYSRTELLSMNWEDLTAPDDLAENVALFEQALAGERDSYVLEKRFVRKDGEIVESALSSVCVRNEDGAADYFLVLVQDITERKRTEEKLRERSELLRAVHEANPDLQFVLDADGTIADYHTHEDAELYVSPKDFIGKKMQDVLPAESAAQFRAAFDTATASGSLVTLDYALPMPAGERVYEARIVPLPDGRLVVTVRDITERSRAEAEREHLLHDTGERVKELRCMYGVAETIRTRETLEQVFEDIVALIPPGWQYPRITRGRIRFDEQEYVSQRFEETEWRQSADIVISGEVHGAVEVFYLEGRPESDEGPFLKEERDLIDGIARALSEAVERKRAKEALRRSNRALRVLSECNEALVRSVDEEALLETMCGIIVDSGGYRLAWIGFAEQDQGKTVRSVAQAGVDEGYLSSLKLTWADSERGRGPTGTAIRTGEASVARDILNEPRLAPWREAVRERGYRSSIALPLRDEGACFGALNIYASELDAFDDDEIRLLKELAEDLAYGIRSLRTRRAQVKAEAETARLNVELELRVAKRTVQLEAANKELESFAYSVSHDLRAPLRGIDGFSKALLEDYGEKLDHTGKDFLNRVRAGTQRMSELIDDLLELSLVTRADFRDEKVDLSAVARDIGEELEASDPDRSVTFIVQSGAVVKGDPRLLRLALTNLLSNAWKFSGGREQTQIEFGAEQCDGEIAYFVRDNGAGFDMVYVDKLFGAFQRLHNTAEFPGTGIGLAIVQRVIRRHGGRVWAEGAVDRGATFHFTVGSDGGNG